MRRLLKGNADRVGLNGINLTFKDSSAQSRDSRSIYPADHRFPVAFLLDCLETQQAFGRHSAFSGMHQMAEDTAIVLWNAVSNDISPQ